MSSPIDLTIDGTAVSVPAGTSIFDAARMNGISIPTLCHQQNETPVGVCRVCVVDTGSRNLIASCIQEVQPGMKVETRSGRVLKSRRTLYELLLADHPAPCARQRKSGDCELERQAAADGVVSSRFPRPASSKGQDESSLVIAVDHDACILCDRCIRGCSEIRGNFVLARAGKGANARIAFDTELPMGSSSCVSCGECMVSCPTGALTNRAEVKTALPHGSPVETADLMELPFFKGVSGTFLDLNRSAIVLRHYKKGDIVCREGEYGSTAFFIVEGRAEVFLSTPISKVQPAHRGGLLARLTRGLSWNQSKAVDSGPRGAIHIDAPVDLTAANPIAELGPGELFGEMTCMNFYPRSATVRAATDCTMYEMLRNVLDVIQRNKTMKARLQENYRQRALDNHLRSVPIFSSLTSSFIDTLRQGAELVSFGPGEIICRQGDEADAFYLIRTGFVKVSEAHPGGDLVLTYLGRGSYFGEIGLLSGGARNATCTALDHVEVVRIKAADFHRMLEAFPDVHRSLEEVARERTEQNARRAQATTVPIDDFLAQGLMEAQSLLVLDLERCTRCDACVKACADAHDGVTRLIRDGLRFDKYLVATSCRQCRDPLCMVGCPVGSIRRRNSLEVIIEDWCIGCGLCAKNCPYGNINMHPFNTFEDDPSNPGRQVAVVKQKAAGCDLCTDLKEPSCVYACPHDAAHRVDPHDLFRTISGSGGIS